MSPKRNDLEVNMFSFPRTRGDEGTFDSLADATAQFSPHARG